MLKTRETYRSHITAYRKIIRSTVRMDWDLWQDFKKETKALNLTTCLVIRALVKQWIEALRTETRHTKMENALSLAGISRNKHGEVRWIYCKLTQTLYDPRKLKSWWFNPQNPTFQLRKPISSRG